LDLELNMQQAKQPRLTVAIPLYNGAEWEETVIQNIQRIPDDALIILSDEVSSDDTPLKIAAQFAKDSRIQVRMHNGLPGWREHCNALIKENNTPLFCLLPQDDLIEPGYYEKLIEALDTNPDAGLVFGIIIAVGNSPAPVTLPSPPFQLGKSLPWLEAILLERYWNLGIPFRAVIRKEILRPIPLSSSEDPHEDMLWVFSMALTTFMLEVPDAVYTKRYHPNNTHTRWQLPSHEERKFQLATQVRNVFDDVEITQQIIAYLEQIYPCSIPPSPPPPSPTPPESRCVRLCRYLRGLVTQ